MSCRRHQHGVEDFAVAGAAAEVAGQRLLAVGYDWGVVISSSSLAPLMTKPGVQ